MYDECNEVTPAAATATVDTTQRSNGPANAAWQGFSGTWASLLSKSIRLLKNAHLLRFPHPLSLRRTAKYASLLRISGALHLGIFEQPEEDHFFSKLL